MPLVILHHLLNVSAVQLANKRGLKKNFHGDAWVAIVGASRAIVAMQQEVEVGVLLAADSRATSSSGYRPSLWDP
jgi:hypothetical protein